MKPIILSVETTCDIPVSQLDQMGVRHTALKLRNETTGEEDVQYDIKEFYDHIRHGNTFKTSLINQFEFEEYFSELLKEGDVLHIGFTGGLSGTCKCAMDAAEKLNENSQNKVYVVDSLTGSGAQAIILKEVINLKNQGKSIEELYQFANDFKKHVCLDFSPEDLKTLAKSGRCNKIIALIGTILNIKPIIYCNDEGKFTIRQKVISRKKALLRLVEMFKQNYNFLSKYVYILHGDKEADALFIKDQLQSDPKFKDVEFNIEYLGEIVGAHGGPGNICLCYTADKR